MLTDTNNYNTSGMVTQIPVEDVEKPVELQRHYTMQKLDYLLQMKKHFKLFVDHKNLVQIFSPKEVSKPTDQKLQRWALELQRFNYEIEHISDEDNVWADLMTRWGAPESVPNPTDESTMKVRRIRRATIGEEIRIRSLQRKDFKWPNLEEIKEEQKKWLNKEESIRVNSEGLAVIKDGRIVIPEKSEDLKLRLCVIAHSRGNSDHLGYQAATQKLAEFCWWKGCERVMNELCTVCLHCLPTRGGIEDSETTGGNSSWHAE
jgi:hypothetical protein